MGKMVNWITNAMEHTTPITEYAQKVKINSMAKYMKKYV